MGCLRGTLVAFVAVIVLAVPAGAQSLSVEAGAAFVHDRDVTPAYGASLYLPFGEIAIGSVSYTRWGAEDGATRLERCGAQGCHAIGTRVVLRAFGSTNYGVFLGGGMTLVEEIRGVVDGTDERTYRGALSLTSVAARSLTESITTFLKGEVTAPAFSSDIQWGFVQAGLVVRLF